MWEVCDQMIHLDSNQDKKPREEKCEKNKIKLCFVCFSVGVKEYSSTMIWNKITVHRILCIGYNHRLLCKDLVFYVHKI